MSDKTDILRDSVAHEARLMFRYGREYERAEFGSDEFAKSWPDVEAGNRRLADALTKYGDRRWAEGRVDALLRVGPLETLLEMNQNLAKGHSRRMHRYKEALLEIQEHGYDAQIVVDALAESDEAAG